MRNTGALVSIGSADSMPQCIRHEISVAVRLNIFKSLWSSFKHKNGSSG